VYLGRRPAFPQWCAEPIAGRRLAVGDAALASDPIAGQGIRFALASAAAAAGAVGTWCDGDPEATARAFYHRFVSDARRRHLGLLAKLYDPQGVIAPQPIRLSSSAELPRRVRFAGHTFLAELSVEGRVVPGAVLQLPDGGLVRWLGSFDILLLRELAAAPVAPDVLVERLAACGLSPAASRGLLRWCLERTILRPDDLPAAPPSLL
jgi:hypothetical protein